MLGTIRDILCSSGRFLASASLMFFALPWLMVLLVLGTVAQRYLGLYASQKLFFGSFILWAGAVPLPGAYATLLLIAGSLIAKLLLKSEISLRRAGTLLVHVSAIVLLLGGLLSAMMREEGYIVLGDGQSANEVSDYRQRELAVTAGGRPLASLAYSRMHAGISFQLPFGLRVLRTCFPCAVQARAQSEGNLRGMAQKLELVSAPYAKDDARNLTGLEFELTGTGPDSDGRYIALEGLADPDAERQKYAFTLAPAQRPLPFAVRLQHFDKSDYPGTDEARAYRSDVTVSDNGLEWNTAIEMNQPLRYKGYTLYQSSYVTDGGRMMSVLAVVKNAGEWFPYIAVTMLCAGLLLHIFLLMHGRKTVRNS